jgi:Major Facilitator Superfamily
MIGTGVAMTSGARARPGSEHAPVLAPLTVLVGSALLVLAQLYLAIPLAPVIGEVFGSGGSAAAAAVGTSYALAYGVGFLIFGPLSDRYGRKLILVAGVAVFAVLTAGLAAAASLPVVALLRTLQGLVAASFGPVALAYVAEALPPGWRSTGIGAMSTAFLSAGILGQVYAQAVAETLGWRWVFGLAAPACMIAPLVMTMILIEPPRTGEPVSLSQKYRVLGAFGGQAGTHVGQRGFLPRDLELCWHVRGPGPAPTDSVQTRRHRCAVGAPRRTPGTVAGSGRRLARRTVRRHPGCGRRLPHRRGRTRRGSHFSRRPMGAGRCQRHLRAGRGHDRARDHRAGR